MKSPSFWWHQKPTAAAHLLRPLGLLYAQISATLGTLKERNAYYASVPVISVGNLTVGGAGKTPLTIWLAEHFAAQGEQVAIVSRGYGGTETTQPIPVNTHNHTARQVGDEPLEMARHFANAPVTVWVAKNRPQGVKRAEQAGATLIILDDGFQRRDVARTINILAINGQNPWGNGLPIPAGPLREDLSVRRRASFAIVMNEPITKSNTYYGVEAYRLTTIATRESLRPLKGPLIAFAALAHPSKFFNTLAENTLNVLEKHSFPDHHHYTGAELLRLSDRAEALGATLITTAKDAAKLPEGFAHVLQTTLTGPDVSNIFQELELRLR